MKYAVVKVVNGSFAISTEHGDNLKAAKIAFHNLCAALENESSVESAEVRIMDENLDCVENFKEHIPSIVESTSHEPMIPIAE